MPNANIEENRKRKFNDIDRSVSPPSFRRKQSQDGLAQLSENSVSSDANLIRIYSWNVNGINPFLQTQLNFGRPNSSISLNPLRAFLKRQSWPHILCLQEVKISPRDEATQRRLEQAANQGATTTTATTTTNKHTLSPNSSLGTDALNDEYTYTAHFSLPRDKFNATGFGGKVYGVATLIRNDIGTRNNSSSSSDNSNCRISTWKPDFDLEGRVLVHCLPDHNISIVNGYWVNGTSNPYHNSITGKVEGTRHDHKLRFHSEMLSLAKDLIEAVPKKHVVLVGDMNVARSALDGHPNLRISPYQHVKNRADFNAKFFTGSEGLHGVDVFREIHGEKRKYTYYPRGREWGGSCDRVDNIIVNRELWDMGGVANTDICDNPGDRGHSDHVPLWVAVDLGKLVAHSRDFH